MVLSAGRTSPSGSGRMRMSAPTTLMAWISTVSASGLAAATSRSAAPAFLTVKKPPAWVGMARSGRAHGRLRLNPFMAAGGLADPRTHFNTLGCSLDFLWARAPPAPSFFRPSASPADRQRRPRLGLRRVQLLDQPVLEGARLGPADRRRRTDEPPRLAAVDDLRERLVEPARRQVLTEQLRRPDRDARALHRRLDRDHGRVEGEHALGLEVAHADGAQPDRPFRIVGHVDERHALEILERLELVLVTLAAKRRQHVAEQARGVQVGLGLNGEADRTVEILAREIDPAQRRRHAHLDLGVFRLEAMQPG